MGSSFGADVVAMFLKNNDLSVICRGHEVPYEGFKYFADRKLVTICSLAEYSQQLNNSSSVMMIDDNSNILFKTISERTKYTGEESEEAMTFLDLVYRKREKAVKLEIEKEMIKVEEERKKVAAKERKNNKKKYKKH